MIRTLLIVVAAGAVVGVASFAGADALGGSEADSPTLGAPAETRDLAWTGTEAIRIGEPSHVTYTQGPTVKFTVTGPKDLVDQLRLDGDQLRGPDSDWGVMRRRRSLIITISGPHTHDFYLSGANRLTIERYDQDSLDLHASGAVSVRATGRAKTLAIALSGAGKVDMGALPVDQADIRMSGAGSITADAKQSADVSISGAGAVKLLSKPVSLHSSISGIGRVRAPD